MNTLRQPLFREATTALLVALLLLQSATAVAPGPAWWGTHNVTDPAAALDDFAVANAGQLKHMARKAMLAMDADLPGGAGAAIHALVDPWGTTEETATKPDNGLAINQGQLKHVATPFYQRLGLPYPWAGGSAVRDDYLLVNLGQLKHVFSFELKFRTPGQGPVTIPEATLQAALDAWNALPAKPLGSTVDDFDGDGIPNLQEYLMGRPLFDPDDIDGDRIPDSIEDASGGILSKLDFADAVRDHDANGTVAYSDVNWNVHHQGDGVMNFEEVLLGLNLSSATTNTRMDGLNDAEVLVWTLNAGAPLALNADPLRTFWEGIDADWIDANWLDSHFTWLDEGDANNDGEPDGLTEFRADMLDPWPVWQPWNPDVWSVQSPSPVSFYDPVTYSYSLMDWDEDGVADVDRDDDGLPDLWEYRYELNLRVNDAGEDPDNDDLSNAEEYEHGTNPRLADSDGDGFDDGVEVHSDGGDPLDSAVGLPLELEAVSSLYQTVAAGGVSSPLAVKVTQGGQPVLGAAVEFAMSSGSGALRSNTSATTGMQVTVTTGSNGIASAAYLAGAAEGSASVTATLAADSAQSAQSADFALSINSAQVTPMFGAPFGGGAIGGGSSSGPVASNPFEAVSLLVGYKWTNAAYGYDTHQDEKRYYFWGDIGDLFRTPPLVASFHDTADKRAQVKQRFEQERVTYLGSPLSWSWIPTVSFSRHYRKVTDGPHYNKEYESDLHHRVVVSLKTQRYVAQAEQPEVSILALVYRDDENNGYTPDPRDPAMLKTSGVIRVKGSASTWSPSLNAYCQKKDDAVIIDAGADSIPEKTNGYVFIDLLPVEINSMDRYLAGSLPQSTIDALGGNEKFGLVFRNTASGEEYRFNKISEAHVYDNPLMSSPDAEDKFLSNSEISAWANGPNSSTKELTQEVVFYRQDGNLHFRGLFDQAGQIEIGLLKDGSEVGKITHTLTPDPDIGNLLETVDSILAGTWDDPGGVILAAMQQGVSGDDLEALQNAANQAAAASFGDQSDAGGFTGFLRRNLTIKVNIPTWAAMKDNFVSGVRKAGEVTARAIKNAAFGGKGFAEGAWMGVKDDASSLNDIKDMILNPAETAKTFYEGFKVLMKLDKEGWKNVGKTLVTSFLEKGEEGVGEWAEPNVPDVAAYLAGFTVGFIAEQVVVTYVTAGIVKAGNIGAKIGKFISDAAKGIPALLKTAAQAVRTLMMKAKNSLFRRFSQDVTSFEDVKTLKRLLQELELACPL